MIHYGEFRLIQVQSKCYLLLDHSNGRNSKGQIRFYRLLATCNLHPIIKPMSNPEKWYRFDPLPADIAQRLQALPNLLAEQGVIVAYLFGSYGLRPGANDIDLALLMPKDVLAFPLREIIADFLNTQRLDIVDLRQANPVLQYQIISTGRSLYVADQAQKLDCERFILRRYKDTIHLRRQQDAILKEKIAQWSLNAKASTND